MNPQEQNRVAAGCWMSALVLSLAALGFWFLPVLLIAVAWLVSK